jgi:hypothetical protein
LTVHIEASRVCIASETVGVEVELAHPIDQQLPGPIRMSLATRGRAIL